MNEDEKFNLYSRVSLEMGLYAGLLLLAAVLRLWRPGNSIAGWITCPGSRCTC
jgi:hypothetical protein